MDGVADLIFLAEQLLQPGEENVAVGFTVPKKAYGSAPKIGWPWRHGVPQFSRRSGGVQNKDGAGCRGGHYVAPIVPVGRNHLQLEPFWIEAIP